MQQWLTPAARVALAAVLLLGALLLDVHTVRGLCRLVDAPLAPPVLLPEPSGSNS